jgi:hypothetical protein
MPGLNHAAPCLSCAVNCEERSDPRAKPVGMRGNLMHTTTPITAQAERRHWREASKYLLSETQYALGVTLCQA